MASRPPRPQSDGAPPENMEWLAVLEESDDKIGRRIPRFQWPGFEWAARNTEISAICIALFVSLLFVPQVTSFQHRDDIERKVWTWLPGRQILEAFEYKLYDERFTKRGVEIPPSRNKIAIVAMDQNSLTIVNQSPWPRSLHARIIRRLKKAGARVIALDIDFSDRQLPGPGGKLSHEDRALIQACADAKNVIFPSLFETTVRMAPGGIKRVYQQQFVSPFVADGDQPGLDEQTMDLCLAYLPQDSDGGYRRYPLKGELSGVQIGSFAALAAGMYQNLLDGDTNRLYEGALRSGYWPTWGNVKTSRKVRVPLRDAALSGEDAPRFWNTQLYFWGPPGTFPTYSYSDVVDPHNFTDETLRKKFNGKIVFIGATAVILKDLFPMPIFPVKNDSVEGSLIPGVEIHASATAMLLDGAYIRPSSTTAMWATLYGLTLFSCVWTAVMRERVSKIARVLQERWHKRKRLRRFRIRIHDGAWFILYGGLSLLPPIVFWGACVWLFAERNIWVVASYPLVSSTLASAVVLVFLFTIESAERRKTLHQVGLYMDRDILEEILAHPEEEFARPRRTSATVMFTDLEGFTSYSENHDADQVVAALNAYMTIMKPIIQHYGGTVDKYIGDAIMAFFGVPIPRYDHAARALACAIEMQEANVRFREKTGIAFHTRIGIHTGELIAGGIGSEGDENNEPHFNFTVIGDTVNLASRLEGKNKEFGSWVMCSRATFEAAPEVAEVEPARTAIKGKADEVEVFIVHGLKGEVRDDIWGRRLTEGEHKAETLPEPSASAPDGEPLALEGGMLALPEHQENSVR